VLSGGCETHMIIHEHALTSRIASAMVTAAQLDHLHAAATSQTVIVQVLPARPDYPVISPAFTLHDIDHQPRPSACSYGPAGQITFVRGRADTAAMQTLFDTLARAALPPGPSARLIARTSSRVRKQS
jgi:hypothetical protein